LDGDLINIGFMVFEPQIFEYIEGDETIFEREPMNALAKQHQLMTYIHKGYWQCMDTLREKQQIDRLWESGKAPWKVWEDQ
ncbi:MAG: glucose-1-phosphate cytidylyltransferase, partial [Candidatus Riflebacteria bacterium]|nr:glucose-1-phosphate cytidylyltransferase [Candidatus Riflebacteria bacterium]